MNICNDCFQKFRTEKQYTEHFERFHKEPYILKDGRIRLNASDQIRLILKDIAGNWEKYFNTFDKKKKLTNDFKDSLRLEQFEKELGIEFIICGSEVKEFRCIR